MYQQEGKSIYCCPVTCFTSLERTIHVSTVFCWAVHIWDVKQETLIVLNVLNSKKRNYLIVFLERGQRFIFHLRDKINIFSYWASASKCSYYSCNSSYHLKITVCAVFIMFFVKTLQCKCFFSLRKIRSECRDYGALVAFSICCWDTVYCIDMNRALYGSLH